MTRVHGRLFDDGRDGILAIKPSKPFFGVDKYERHYPVSGGEIDINLMPTPRGFYYNVGFKEEGDLRDTPFTLQWRIPASGEIDVTPGAGSSSKEVSGNSKGEEYTQLTNRRLVSELATALEEKKALEREAEQLRQAVTELKKRVKSIEHEVEVAMALRDQELELLRSAATPKEKTLYVRVPVLPGPLKDRISQLEAENNRLRDINATYYKSVLELNQLKLERAQTAPLPHTAEEYPDNNRMRLIQKLRAK